MPFPFRRVGRATYLGRGGGVSRWRLFCTFEAKRETLEMSNNISTPSNAPVTAYNKKVAIVGAGSMGRSIAICLAMHQIPTVIQARSLERQKRAIPLLEQSLAECGEIFGWNEDEQKELLNRIKVTVDNADLALADIVIEATSGTLEEHKELYRDLDAVLRDDTVIASITSSISITELSNATERPSLVAGMHFFMPVPLIDLVEIVSAQHTVQETLDQIQELCDAMGKETVYVEDSPGYIVNRMLIPMINEAITELAQGIGSIEDIDRAMRIGANHPMGPLELADWIGLDTCLEILEGLFAEFMDSKYRPHPLLRRKVRAGQLGRKAGVGFYRYKEEE